MALRTIAPLDDEQWKILVHYLTKKPTARQRRMIKEAVEFGSKIKEMT